MEILLVVIVITKIGINCLNNSRWMSHTHFHISEASAIVNSNRYESINHHKLARWARIKKYQIALIRGIAKRNIIIPSTLYYGIYYLKNSYFCSR